MKTQNSILIATVAALAFALAPVTEAAPNIEPPLPVISIYTGWGGNHICRGRGGSFTLEEIGVPFSGAYVNFKVSGTAIPGVDYVALVSPAYVPPSGFGEISFATMLDRRGSFNNQAYSVVVTLEPGPGYTVSENSAVIWITSSCGVD